MTHLTTDDALCRRIADFTEAISADEARYCISACRRCPLLDACRRATDDMVERRIGPRGIVQAGIWWSLDGKPRADIRAPEPEPEPDPEPDPDPDPGPRTCKRGHLVDGHNAIATARGYLTCRACQNMARRAKRRHRTTAQQWAIEQGDAA